MQTTATTVSAAQLIERDLEAAANSPVLNALNERLDTSLAPRIAQMRQTLGPVRDAVANVSNAVTFVSTLPGMAERAPRLALGHVAPL